MALQEMLDDRVVVGVNYVIDGLVVVAHFDRAVAGHSFPGVGRETNLAPWDDHSCHLRHNSRARTLLAKVDAFGATRPVQRYALGVRTLILDPPTAGLGELLTRRRRSGLDRLDEVWEGVLHMVPAPGEAHARITQQLAELLGPLARAAGLIPMMGEFNLGASEHDFRVPDGGLHRAGGWGTWAPTAAVVVEITSPGDETWEKLPFYGAHHVDELLIVDPAERRVKWLALVHGEYQPIERSSLIDLGAADLAERIDWPSVDNG